ncbi:hypothetical protein LSI01_12020 [Furfurilactobacillus siliginis]|uniref:Uncharacterized protein n=1 Tax=Furfurilactobacillus siliginis TaxID=348151 RepID=A0A510VS68_9LACO|nr:hypothetical protein LSI01_12020 [Furfurilactobacillus siliginis]
MTETKAQRECEYCHKPFKKKTALAWDGKSDDIYQIELLDNDFVLSSWVLDGEGWSGTSGFVEISDCPWCGRELKETE